MKLFGWEKVSRDDKNYKACLAITSGAGAVIGAAVGSPVPVAGTVAGYAAGAVWGFAAGFVLCPYLAPAVKRKIENGLPMTEAEVRNAAEAMGQYASLQDAPDAVKLVSFVKALGPSSPRSLSCEDPADYAKHLLKTT
jgi:hypothetical protein